MKYICINPFPNPQGNPIAIVNITGEDGKVLHEQKPVAGAVVKNAAGKDELKHIHKGAIFNIGSATEFKDLSPDEKELVSHLMVSKKIADATPATIKKVAAEVEADDARAARDAKRDAKADPMKVIADALENLPAMIAAAVSAAVNAPPKEKK